MQYDGVASWAGLSTFASCVKTSASSLVLYPPFVIPFAHTTAIGKGRLSLAAVLHLNSKTSMAIMTSYPLQHKAAHSPADALLMS